MYVASIQCLNYSGEESKKQFAVDDSDKSVTLKKDQGCQTWYKLVKPKLGYNHAKFEIPSLYSIYEKANTQVFVNSGIMVIISF